MSDNRREEEQKFPTHNEIQKRAHELYLARGDKGGQDIEDWLLAEEQLRREHSERVGTKTTTFVAGPGGVAKTSSSSERDDLIIAQEERSQVRAAEELKEASSVPGTKPFAGGQTQKK